MCVRPGSCPWPPCLAFALLAGHRGDAVDGERVAVDAEAADDGLPGKRYVGMSAPGLTGVNVAAVAFDRGHADRLDGVMAGDRRMGEAARIEHDAQGLLGARLLNPIDDHPFMIGLPEFHAIAVGVGGLPAELLDGRERGAAIDVRLAGAEKIEVRSVENVNRVFSGGFGHCAPWGPVDAATII